jgi:hypothetical protein
MLRHNHRASLTYWKLLRTYYILKSSLLPAVKSLLAGLFYYGLSPGTPFFFLQSSPSISVCCLLRALLTSSASRSLFREMASKPGRISGPGFQQRTVAAADDIRCRLMHHDLASLHLAIRGRSVCFLHPRAPRPPMLTTTSNPYPERRISRSYLSFSTCSRRGFGTRVCWQPAGVF